MHVTIIEHRQIAKELAGAPWRLLYVTKLGAHGQAQYGQQALIYDYDGKPDPRDLERMRQHAVWAASRIKALRKAGKRFPIEFHVEPQ